MRLMPVRKRYWRLKREAEVRARRALERARLLGEPEPPPPPDRLVALKLRHAILAAAVREKGALGARRLARLKTLERWIECEQRPRVGDRPRQPKPAPPPARNWAAIDINEVHTHRLEQRITAADIVRAYAPRPGPSWTSPYWRS
jgi:hypothetical protein